MPVEYMVEKKLKTPNQSADLLTGTTSKDADHFHEFKVDENGNGYALMAFHPDNDNIRHEHEIINWTVQKAESECYPDCEQAYGIKGAPPHIHEIPNRGDSVKSLASMYAKRTNFYVSEYAMSNVIQQPTVDVVASQPMNVDVAGIKKINKKKSTFKKVSSKKSTMTRASTSRPSGY